MKQKDNLRLVIDSRKTGGDILGITLIYNPGADAWELIHDEVRYVVKEQKT